MTNGEGRMTSRELRMASETANFEGAKGASKGTQPTNQPTTGLFKSFTLHALTTPPEPAAQPPLLSQWERRGGAQRG